jgi:hypothetical protein
VQLDGRANPTGVGAGVLVGADVLVSGVVAAVGTGLELTLVCVGVAAGTAAVHESASAAASERIVMYFMCKIIRPAHRSSTAFGGLPEC